MTNNHRGTAGVVGVAVAALLVAPAISLPTSPVAAADEITGPTQYSIPGIGTETVTIDHTTGASDFFLQTNFGTLDMYSNPATHFSEDVYTFYPYVQEVVQDNNGAVTFAPADTNPADFISTDPGAGYIEPVVGF
jgi:hypothetical protein